MGIIFLVYLFSVSIEDVATVVRNVQMHCKNFQTFNFISFNNKFNNLNRFLKCVLTSFVFEYLRFEFNNKFQPF